MHWSLSPRCAFVLNCFHIISSDLSSLCFKLAELCDKINTWWLVPRGAVNFVSRESQCFPIRNQGKHLDSRETKFTVPQGTSHWVICYIAKQNKNKFWKTRWDSSDNIRPPSTARSDHMQQRSTFRGTVNCFPFDVIVFAMLPALGIWRWTVLLLNVIWPRTRQWMGVL